MATHPVPPPPPVVASQFPDYAPSRPKVHIVGTRSHPFIGAESAAPGTPCIGVLGSREGKVCAALRSAPIHDNHRNWCSVCDGEIKTMTFKGTGVCSELHRKQRDGEPLNKYRAVAP